MKWLLMIVLVSPSDYVDFEPIEFESRAACISAAEAFVEAYPAFELRDPSDETAVVNPVVRSHVECVPASSGEDND